MKYRVSLPRFKLTSDEVINMGTCRTIQNATFLDISGNSGANDEAISKIKLEELKILNLSFNPIQNPGIIFEKFKNLVDLDMRGIALDRECVEIISKCDELKLSTFSFQKCDNVDDINLLSSKAMKNITSIYCGPISNEAITAMCQNMRLKKLKIYGITNASIQIISESENMSLLETLVLLNNRIDGTGLLSIANSKFLNNLTELNIAACNPVLDPFKELMKSENLKKLKTLQINNTLLTNEHVKAIAQNLSELTCLEVHGSKIRQNDIKTISQSPAMRNLTELRVTSNNIGDEGLISLANSDNITELRSLLCFGSIITTDAIATMCLSTNFANLTDISLSEVSNDGVRCLTQSKHITKLEKLYLCKGSIDVNGCEMLSMCENLVNLKFLLIGSNPLGDEGVYALVNSPYITKLLDLDLFSVGLTDEGVKSIVQSNNLIHLEKLFLASNNITDIGAELLAVASNLKKLKGLHFTNNPITQVGKDALTNSISLKRCNIKVQ
ncbi:leucine rich repeat family protein [Naegleria gruberi]|uniref:Leucine rich repeat family protein n=1 Tax=Naegleria gruberi TaxID=5762 RepID=D2VIH9_NAEGR|nr:leucine rich repeat family protein [Naegleria gruberi]EFC43269.1 leucine rich repeat family protein [Naegleria gruberi]|eukprot:XP_002676013.1 leucine rich repeat family protein [Naegleria gruberi strain NEG-M]